MVRDAVAELLLEKEGISHFEVTSGLNCHPLLIDALAECVATHVEPDVLADHNQVRTLCSDELTAMPVLAQGAALRFLLTRLYDLLNHVEGALVRPKNPLEYLQRLRFHRGVRSPAEYGLGAP